MRPNLFMSHNMSQIALAEAIPEIVKVTTTMIPALQNVKLLRGLIVTLKGTGSMDETKALEEYNTSRDKHKAERKKVRDRNNSKVIKIKDALQCVEDTLGQGKIGIAFAKALLSVITQKAGASQDMLDVIYGPIQDCMLKHALGQKNRRSHGWYEKFKKGHSGDPPDPPTDPVYTELVRLRRGKLHPFIPDG